MLSIILCYPHMLSISMLKEFLLLKNIKKNFGAHFLVFGWKGAIKKKVRVLSIVFDAIRSKNKDLLQFMAYN